MEQQGKPTDTHLKSMLNSPAKFTPAVPVPDWSAPSPAATSTVQCHPTTLAVCC